MRAPQFSVLRSSSVVKALNVLILVALLAGVGAIGSIALTVVQLKPSVDLGALQMSTAGTVTKIQIPVNITNKGPLSISDINVQATVTDSAGDKLASGGVGPVTIAAGTTSNLVLLFTLDTSNLPSSALQSLVTTSQNLTLSVVVATSLPPFLKLSGTASAALPWGAPVANLRVGTPNLAPYNSTAIQVSVPVSFDNDNQFMSINGAGMISLVDAGGRQVARGTVQLNAPSGSHFDATAQLLLGIPQSQIQSLMFNDQTLQYTASFSANLSGFQTALTQNFQLSWGAPVKNLVVGSATFSPFNSTQARLAAPVSFTDNSAFLSVSGTLTGTISDASGNQVGSITPLMVTANPGQTFASSLTGYVNLSAANGHTFVLNLTFQSSFGTVTVKETINA